MKIISILLLALLSGAAYSSGFRCISGSVQRLIRLDFPGQQHLCEVAVTDQDGARDVKWFANSNSSFCSEKIAELTGKYQNLWGYECEAIPHTTDISNLSPRYRQFVDDLVKDAASEGEEAEIPFVVTATRVRSTELEASSNNALVVQLFMNARDDAIKTPVDRTYFIEDNGTQFRTRSVWSGLRHKITLDDANYRVDSALINRISPQGEIEVETKMLSASKDDTTTQTCTGSQLLLTSDSGELTPAGQHTYQCN